MNTCRHCGSQLLLTQTKRTPQQLLKPYYYSAYYRCSRCGRMYHSEEFKIKNQNYDLFSGQTELGVPVDIEIWTDGACVNNGKPNASAAWAFVSGEYEQAGRVEGKQTNNRAEAEAILHALRWAAEHKHRRVKILCDTQITIYGLQKPLEKIVANKDIFEKIFNVINSNDLLVQYEKVLGHSGIAENERVDKLANTLATQSA